jgi:hypothetical protein
MMRWHMIDLSPAQRGPFTVKNVDASHCGFGGGGYKLLVDNRRNSVKERPEVEWSRKQDARGREGEGGMDGWREGGREGWRDGGRREQESERAFTSAGPSTRLFAWGGGYCR